MSGAGMKSVAPQMTCADIKAIGFDENIIQPKNQKRSEFDGFSACKKLSS